MILNTQTMIKINSKTLADHKRRLDRGGTYYGYFQMIATATILVRVFNIDSWWVYVLGAVLIMVVRYVMGYLDERKKILANEQDGYNKENPAIQKILTDLNYIKKQLKGVA